MHKTYRYCKICNEVHETGLECAEARREAKRERRRRARLGGRAVSLRTDTNWARQGTIYPGLNNNKPLEERAAFQREIDAKGVAEFSLRDIKNLGDGEAYQDRKMAAKLEAVRHKYAHA